MHTGNWDLLSTLEGLSMWLTTAYRLLPVAIVHIAHDSNKRWHVLSHLSLADQYIKDFLFQ